MMPRPLLWLALMVVTSLTFFQDAECSVTLKSATTSSSLINAKRVYIKQDVDLGGRTIYLSKKSRLICRRGSVSNGEIVFNETEISGKPALYCKISGTVCNDVIVVDWFLSDNDLDHLYDNGVLSLLGMSIIEFHNQSYVSRVHGRNDGITLTGVTIDGKGATIMSKQGGSTNKSLLMLSGCNNLALRNVTLIGSTEASKEGGARHNLSLYNCNNVELENIISQNAYTDGLYIRKSRHLSIDGFKAFTSGRQGCSVTEGADVFFKNCSFDGSYRVAPMAGLDIEPNYDTDIIDNIVIEDCSFTNNKSSGLTIKLKTRGKGATCRIRVENCLFDGNNTSISVGSAPNSGDGFIDISNCFLKNSKGVSFQSKCYSAVGTPRVIFHNSILENANLNEGSDVREQAAFISVHNVSSHPLPGNFGNIELHSLMIKQKRNKLKFIKHAINIYPDAKYEVENVSITKVSFDFDEQEGGTKMMHIPRSGVKSMSVEQ